MSTHHQVPEIFRLPDGTKITPRETILVGSLASKIPGPSMVLSGVVKGRLMTVFGDNFRTSREDMENLLNELNPELQKKILRAYFFGLLGEEGFNIRRDELEKKIAAFPEKNWTNDDWAVFGNLAPQPSSAPKNIFVRKQPSTEYARGGKSTYEGIQLEHTGRFQPRNFKRKTGKN